MTGKLYVVRWEFSYAGNGFQPIFDIREIPPADDLTMLARLTINDTGKFYGDDFGITILCGRDRYNVRQSGKQKASWKFIKCERFDPDEVEAQILALVDRCASDRFEQWMDCLRKHFNWEYEGMKPAPY
ncbi:hypothetical protein [Roseibium aggregatum]|uniref:Uncharacterized protein n=1 Tax=Roseibium aggregatum TaxID=187304 RepID=A0A926S740_9HYPH|nr:hypothetical protein [Roseibium aggregatum]MBD1548226.1 hypothetical protein [Roseibium aggregatum]